ncbi:MAG TPA: S8 family serine peptidase, partial [Pyrinomonadaceae bacterium]|nr:S8 family serine peptidase [Pyrinomonadaceae bacterium]
MPRPAPPLAPSRPPRGTRFLACAAALCLSASLLTALTAHGQDEPLPAETQQPKRRRADYVPGEVLVRFRGESAAAAFAAEKGLGDAPALMRADGGPAIPVKVERFEGAEMVAGLRLARVRPEETWEAVSALRSRPDVAYAEPNYKRRLFRAPDDPRFLDLWGLRAAGSEHLFEGATGYGIDAERAWDITTGDRGVVVGVVDEGINVSHPDLNANVWVNPGEVPGNGLDDDGNGYADDAHGWDFFHDDSNVYDGFGREDHGSHVAGTIGAVGDNGVGVVGVNWRVSLMSLKVLGGEGETGSFTTVTYTIRAFNYARRMRELWQSSGGTKGANVRVLNNSYGGFDDSAAEFDAVRALGDAGILFVAAAGNEGRSNDTFPAFPASYDLPNVISVAGGGGQDNLLNYTNFGQQSVHLSAPGFAVLSTTSLGYDFYQGTSMASPHVAGTAALICAAHPDIPLRRLRDLLLLNGDPYPAHEGMTMTRRRLNAFKSLRAAAEADAAPPARIDDLRLVSQRGRRLVLAWTSPGDDGSRAGTAALYEIRFTPKLPATEAEFMAGHPLYAPLPEGARRAQGAAVTLPLRHASGFVSIRALDNVGNHGELASVPVSVAPEEADPYLVADSDPRPLSTGGTWVTAGDDRARPEYPLPFAFPIFGRWVRHVDVSTNGALYFELPPDYRLPPVTYRGVLIDAEPTTRALRRYFMIAPLWDDLRMDRAPDRAVWAVRPDADRIIFRWDGVTFDTRLEAGGTRGEHPVHFEVELRRDGTIQMRYGEGNTRVFPVVGISGGTPDADAGYVVASHTSEYALKDLTRARTLTFTPRRAPRPTSSDLRLRVINNSDRVAEGGQINYTFLVDTLGPDAADNVTFSYPLPPGTTFVAHDTQSSLFPEIRCSVPAAGATGRINCNLGRVGEFYHTRVKAVLVTLQARAPAGSALTGAASVTHATADPSAANNTAATGTVVAGYQSLRNVKAIAPGFALLRDGSLWHWGRHLGSALVNTFDVEPVRVNLTGVTSVASVVGTEGLGHALALKADGTVWAWGSNQAGQLGMGKPERELFGLMEPRQVPGLTSVKAVSAGPSQSIALKTDGTVWTWGDVGVASLAPAKVAGLTGVVSVNAGGSNFAAVKSDGTVWMWGSNFNGLLADGTTLNSATPVRVRGITDAVSVSVSDNFALALRRDGSVWAWGKNSNGQLGDGTLVDRAAPGPVPGLSGVTSVSAGGSSGGSIALKADGTVWVWPPQPFVSPPPPSVPTRLALPAATAVATSIHINFYVLLADGTVRSWGDNSFGQVGEGGTEYQHTPMPVRFLAGVAAPAFDPDGRTLIVPREVKISCPTDGAVIRYTTDGREPTEVDPVVASGAGVWVGQNMTLRAKAWKAGWTPSLVTTARYQVAGVANVIDTPQFFVAQHYRDFLSREPDAGGLSFWSRGITSCGTNQQCVAVKRVDTSAAFFLSIEFQETGYLAYRFYKAAYGDAVSPGVPGTVPVIRLEEFLPDTRRIGEGVVVGAAGWAEKLEANKQAFALEFVARPRFAEAFPASLTPAQFVDRLDQRAGGVLTAQERTQLIAQLTAINPAGGRAAALRA